MYTGIRNPRTCLHITYTIPNQREIKSLPVVQLLPKNDYRAETVTKFCFPQQFKIKVHKALGTSQPII